MGEIQIKFCDETMLKHRFSKTPEKKLNVSSDDEIIEAGITFEQEHCKRLSLDDIDRNFDIRENALRTSTRRVNMEQDLKEVWDILGDAYKKQIKREDEFMRGLQRKSKSASILDDTGVFKMDKTINQSIKWTPKSMRTGSTNPSRLGNRELSTNAIADPWIIKFTYDDSGYKVYEDIEFNMNMNKTFEGSQLSRESLNDDFYFLESKDTSDYEDIQFCNMKTKGKTSHEEPVKKREPKRLSKKRSLRQSISRVLSGTKLLRMK